MSVETEQSSEADAMTTGAPTSAAVSAPPAPDPTPPALEEAGRPDGAGPAANGAAPRAARGNRLKRILIPLIVVLIVAAAAWGFTTWRSSVLYVSTDNASIAGQQIQIGSMNAGEVDAIYPNVGAVVQKGDPVAEVELPSQIGTAQNGQPKLGFLGQGDTRVQVQAPSDGVIIEQDVGVGSTVAQGESILTMIDPTQLYVVANVNETDVARVKVGQPVSVHVDALDQDVPGRVQAVTPATAASFSLLPQQNTSGNFNKVTQLVPVQIAISLGNQPALLGASVEVQIQVAQ